MVFLMMDQSDEFYMKEALREAELAFEAGEVPVGAVLVYEGEIIARGHNQKEEKKDASSHAEIEAIREGERILNRWDLTGCTLYVTLEPCLMCAGAILQSRLSRLVFGADDPQRGAIVSCFNAFEYFKKDSDPLVSRGVLSSSCQDILLKFFRGVR